MKKMFFLFPLLAALAFGFVGCDDDDDVEIQIVDPTIPTGDFVAQRSGTFTAQSGTPTSGTVELGLDDDSEQFLRFADNFTTELGTGTVTIYLSTSENFVTDPGNGNPDLMLVAAVARNGESFYRINGTVDAKYTHVILWCGSANIPFGNALLQ